MIDPDLGVNVVDLGFVRQVEIQDRVAVITMTLTSAACPLTSIMEDQIRTELAGLGDLAGFRVELGLAAALAASRYDRERPRSAPGHRIFAASPRSPRR